MHSHKSLRKIGWEEPITHGCAFSPEINWISPTVGTEDLRDIINRIAGGEFQRLRAEVFKLSQEVKDLKRVLVTEEAILESWDDEYDSWWEEDA